MGFLTVDRDGVEVFFENEPKLCIKYKLHEKDYFTYLYGAEAEKFHSFDQKEKLSFVKEQYLENPFRDKLEHLHEETLNMLENGKIYFVSDLLYRTDDKNNFFILPSGLIEKHFCTSLTFGDPFIEEALSNVVDLVFKGERNE